MTPLLFDQYNKSCTNPVQQSYWNEEEKHLIWIGVILYRFTRIVSKWRDIISIYDEMEDTESSSWEEIDKTLQVLFSNWQGQKYLEKPSKNELLELAREARDLTLDKLIKD